MEGTARIRHLRAARKMRQPQIGGLDATRKLLADSIVRRRFGLALPGDIVATPLDGQKCNLCDGFWAYRPPVRQAVPLGLHMNLPKLTRLMSGMALAPRSMRETLAAIAI